MANHKFRLSNMIPNAWFYKLKEMATNNRSPTSHHPTKQKHSPPPIPTSTKPDHGLEEVDHSIPFPPPPQPHHPRKSYHFTRNFNSKSSDSSDIFYCSTLLDPPRKSSRRRRPTTKKRTNSSTPNPASTPTAKNSSSSSLSAGYSCRATATATVQSFRPKLGSSSHQESFTSTTTTTSSSVNQVCHLPEFDLPSNSFDRTVAWSVTEDDDHKDVMICVDNMSPGRRQTLSSIGLPPIRTEHKKFSDLVKEIGETQDHKQRKSSVRKRERVKRGKGSLPVKILVKEDSMASNCVLKEQGSSTDTVGRVSTGSPRVRIRINSPRLSRRMQVGNIAGGRSRSSWRRKISSESLAVVKSSSDPQRDFRESMVEMIVENNIRASKELEELLACYLSLNSMEYHHVIIQVFKQIWFDLNDAPRGTPALLV